MEAITINLLVIIVCIETLTVFLSMTVCGSNFGHPEGTGLSHW